MKLYPSENNPNYYDDDTFYNDDDYFFSDGSSETNDNDLLKFNYDDYNSTMDWSMNEFDQDWSLYDNDISMNNDNEEDNLNMNWDNIFGNMDTWDNDEGDSTKFEEKAIESGDADKQESKHIKIKSNRIKRSVKEVVDNKNNINNVNDVKLNIDSNTKKPMRNRNRHRRDINMLSSKHFSVKMGQIG